MPFTAEESHFMLRLQCYTVSSYPEGKAEAEFIVLAVEEPQNPVDTAKFSSISQNKER